VSAVYGRRTFRGLLLIPALLLVCLPGAASAAIPTGPTTLDGYQMFTIGDSYASGEGAPDVDGQYDDNGDLVGQFEDWDTRFDGSPATPGPNQDSTRCHRSGTTSTSAVARSVLATQFPDVSFNWVSVACSGGSIVQTGKIRNDPPPVNKGGVLTGYDGADDLRKRNIPKSSLSPAVYPPQLSQINTILAARPSGPTRRIDALVMNLGGNDAGFGEVITACLNINFLDGTSWGDCNNNEEVADFLSGSLSTLNGRFNRLAASLRGEPVSPDPKLNQQPADVFLTAAPNPLRATASTYCNRQPEGNYEEELTGAESEWVEANVVNPLNARFATEATQHGWELVNAHVNTFFGHAICSPDNWINQNLQALRRQGELDETEGVPIAVSGGIAHPNRSGFAAIGGALAADMRPYVVDRYTPNSAPVTTTTSRATGFRVDLSDANLTTLRSGYWHRIRLRQLNSSRSTTDVEGADRNRDLAYGTLTRDYPRTGRYFVSTRACGPLSRDGTLGCGPITSELRVSTFVPAQPINFTARAGDAPSAVMPTPGIDVRWEHASVLALHDTRRTVIRVRRKDTGATVATQTHEGPFTSALVMGLATGVDYLVSVKACNDGNRCSSLTPEVQTRAGTGSDPLTFRFSPLGQIRINLEGVPCVQEPVVFDPSLSGDPDFEDATPTFQPSCAGEPTIGRIALAKKTLRGRAGRPIAVDLRWRHPNRWRALHEVSLQFVRRGRALATLRFDQDANTLTLARGNRRRGKSVLAGTARTLRAGGVKVRLRKDAVLGSGPTGASVRLRFGAVLPRAARPQVGIAVGATDDAGQRQQPIPAGLVRLR
jgi:hypothetical protein